MFTPMVPGELLKQLSDTHVVRLARSLKHLPCMKQRAERAVEDWRHWPTTC